MVLAVVTLHAPAEARPGATPNAVIAIKVGELDASRQVTERPDFRMAGDSASNVEMPPKRRSI